MRKLRLRVYDLPTATQKAWLRQGGHPIPWPQDWLRHNMWPPICPVRMALGVSPCAQHTHHENARWGVYVLDWNEEACSLGKSSAVHGPQEEPMAPWRQRRERWREQVLGKVGVPPATLNSNTTSLPSFSKSWIDSCPLGRYSHPSDSWGHRGPEI